MSAKKGLLVLISLVGMVPKVQAAEVLRDAKDSWAEEAVRQLYERGIITSLPDGSFRGNDPLTRYGAAVLLWRTYLALMEEVTKTLQEALDQHEVNVSEILRRLQDLERGLTVLEEKTGGLDAARTAIEEIQEGLEGLRADLTELVGVVASKEEVEGAMDTLASLEDTLSRQDAHLKEFKEHLNTLVQTLDERKAEAEQMAERIDALEKFRQEVMEKPRVGVRFGSGPNAVEAFISASTPNGKLEGGLTERGLEVDGEALPVRFTYRDGEGLLAYRLFSGVYLEPGLGGKGETFFLQGRLVHDTRGGLVPGLYLEGIGRYTLPISGTNPSFTYGVKAGYQFGEVFPTLAYYSADYSALEGSLTWRGNGFSLYGAYRFLANPNGAERGGHGLVGIRTASEVPNEGRVYISASLSYAKGVTNGEPLSFGRPYRFTNTGNLEWRFVVGYEVGW